MVRGMAKVSVTIADSDLREVEQAAQSAGLSVSAFMARAATHAAMAEARRQYELYLAEDHEAAGLIGQARQRALSRGAAARHSSAQRRRQAAA